MMLPVKYLLLPAIVVSSSLLALGACSSDDDDDSSTNTSDNTDTANNTPDPDTLATATFFVTSAGPGDGGNLGGLPGADAVCGNLAEAAGMANQEWRAYLSTTGADGINASERIGNGPWTNVFGVVVAEDVANLLSDSNNLDQTTAVTETGSVIGGVGDSPNQHDILTGTELNGLASTDTADTTCFNWTSNDAGNALVGHHDRMGSGANPNSWSTAHPSAGCSQQDLIDTAGNGLFYCFVPN